MGVHANISVFVPHMGCAHRCSFCNQNLITGKVDAPTPEDVKLAVETAVRSPRYNPAATEIAFFGGSFTAIEVGYMRELLGAAYPFVMSGAVCGIRISTRPDAISDEILELLKSYGVTAIELGAQSMSDEVLALNHRGHTAEEVILASGKIKQFNFSLGLQMMTGLYGDTDVGAVVTAERFKELSPDTVRIYPTIVLKNTYLERLYKEGSYQPQSLPEAVDLCAWLVDFFDKNNISVIRTGLHTVENDSFVAGPWHPAFGELCEGRMFLNRALEQLSEKGDYRVFVSSKSLSKMIGQKRCNVEILQDLGYNCFIYADDALNGNDLVVIKGCATKGAD